MTLLGYAALTLAVLYAVHRAACWAESRGWIRYRDSRGRSAALGNALLEVHTLIEPSKRFVLEERLRDEADEEDSGDPPSPPSGR